MRQRVEAEEGILDVDESVPHTYEESVAPPQVGALPLSERSHRHCDLAGDALREGRTSQLLAVGLPRLPCFGAEIVEPGLGQVSDGEANERLVVLLATHDLVVVDEEREVDAQWHRRGEDPAQPAARQLGDLRLEGLEKHDSPMGILVHELGDVDANAHEKGGELFVSAKLLGGELDDRELDRIATTSGVGVERVVVERGRKDRSTGRLGDIGDVPRDCIGRELADPKLADLLAGPLLLHSLVALRRVPDVPQVAQALDVHPRAVIEHEDRAVSGGIQCLW